MDLSFEFATATRIIFGPGKVREIGKLASDLGRCALLVTGQDPKRARPVSDSLEAAGVQSSVFCVRGEPELSTATAAAAQAKAAGCALVISCGGGSAIDAGKAAAAVLTNPGDLLDYLEVIGKAKPLPNRSAPFIAVPTTAGTGSEVTRNAVLASPEHRVKVSLRSASMLARVAIIDPELTYGLPRDITISTGLDALTQLIEPYVCSRPNPLTDGLCVEGIPRVARSLATVCDQPENAAARSDMCLASLFGGLALANAGLGAVHGFAGPIGGMFGGAHGAMCAALLPHVMDINLNALRRRQPGSETLTRYATVARLLTGDLKSTPEDGVAWVLRLVRQLGVSPLGALGVSSDCIEEIVNHAAKSSSMKANPINLTREELCEIVRRSI